MQRWNGVFGSRGHRDTASHEHTHTHTHVYLEGYRKDKEFIMLAVV